MLRKRGSRLRVPLEANAAGRLRTVASEVRSVLTRGTIAVDLSDGVFSSERIARFADGPNEIRLVADLSDIVDGRLLVDVLWAALDKALIRLPGMPFMGSDRTLVSLHQLRF